MRLLNAVLQRVAAFSCLSLGNHTLIIIIKCCCFACGEHVGKDITDGDRACHSVHTVAFNTGNLPSLGTSADAEVFLSHSGAEGRRTITAADRGVFCNLCSVYVESRGPSVVDVYTVIPLADVDCIFKGSPSTASRGSSHTITEK